VTDQELWDLAAPLRRRLIHWLAQSSPDLVAGIGPPVAKDSGDYAAEGTLVALFPTPQGRLRAVVAHPVRRGHMAHIYSAANLNEG
jgi:hypothetical protein